MKLAVELLEPLVPIIVTLILTLLGMLMQTIRKRVNSEYLRSLTFRLEDVASSVVRELEQTTVGEIKRRAADSRLTQDDIEYVGKQALAKVKLQLGTKGLSELKAALKLADDEIDQLLRSKIEASVADERGTGPGFERLRS